MYLVYAALGVLLSLSAHPDGSGVLFAVTSDAPRHFYAQVDHTPGLSVEPSNFEFDLDAGESFGSTIAVMPWPNAYTGPEYITVSVWDDGGAPVAVQRFAYPRSPYPHLYIPIMR